jgi:Flp pilus assembly protein protease CpaA
MIVTAVGFTEYNNFMDSEFSALLSKLGMFLCLVFVILRVAVVYKIILRKPISKCLNTLDIILCVLMVCFGLYALNRTR